MSKKRLLVVLFIAAAFLVMPGMARAQELDGMPRQLALQFATHPEAGMVEPDAYVEAGDGMVRRVAPEEAAEYLDAPVFGTAEEVHHDPFGLSPELMEAHEVVPPTEICAKITPTKEAI